MAKEEKYFLKEHQRTVKGDPRKQSCIIAWHRNKIKEKAHYFLRTWSNIKTLIQIIVINIMVSEEE